MTHKLQYLFLEDKKIAIFYGKGKISINEIIEFKKTVFSDKNYNPNFNRIYDFRELEFLFELKELTRYIEFISNNRFFLGKRKSAVITNSPNQVVIGMGFDILKNKLPIEVKVCSTIETAISFIGISKINWEFVKALIRKLNKAALKTKI